MTSWKAFLQIHRDHANTAKLGAVHKQIVPVKQQFT